MGESVQSFQARVRKQIEASRDALKAFCELPEAASFKQVVTAYDRIRKPLDEANGIVGIYSAVHPDKALRECSEELEQEIVVFDTELSLDRRVYERLAALDQSAAPNELDCRLLERALRDYRRSGVDRDEATRKRIRELQDELVEIGQNFDRNIVQGARSMRVAEGHAGLAGLPEDYLANHPEDAAGAVTITTDGPDFVPFMMYAERGDLRQRLAHEYLNRAYPENIDVLSQLLAKRAELAQLLGYANWAEYVTEDKMVKDPRTARAFIERVAALARPKADKEYAELLEEKRKLEPDATDVRGYETAFLEERVKRSRFDFDSQAVRPYFGYERVKQGIFETSRALFNVDFVANTEVPVWHASVECYDIVDDGKVVARFYLDMFPREGKYKHAAMFDVRHGIAGEVMPEAALVCNFPQPTKDDPALMLHDQVTTFFHEFGHLLHHLFSGRLDYIQFSGTSTEWDFVEVPSQLYEEWAWNVGVLQSFARHHETDEPIPAELVEKLRTADEYGKGLHVTRQMYYAMLSLTFYDSDPATLDTTERMIELAREMLPVPYEPDTHFQASFGHLHGYSAIYYTYMWSLVISKDLFSSFEADPMDTATANHYRQTILSAGGSKDADDLVVDFMGRAYAFDAWEAWLSR